MGFRNPVTTLAADQITAGTLPADVIATALAAGIVDAEAIAQDAVVAEKIAAAAIVAHHLGFGVRSTNLVTNPGFEQTDTAPPLPGTYPTAPGWAIDTTPAGAGPSGVQYATGTWPAARGHGKAYIGNTGGATPGAIARSDPFPVEAGAGYLVQLAALANNGTPALSVAIETPDGTGGWTTTVVDTATTGQSWATVTSEWTAPPGTTTARIRLQHTGGPATASSIYLDDVAALKTGAGAVEITEAGIRMWDAEGSVSIDLSSVGAAGSFASFGAGLASVSDTGAVAGREVIANEALTYRGEELADLLGEPARGVLAWATVQVRGQSLTAGTIKGIFELSFDAEPGRIYRVRLSGGMFALTTANTPSGPFLRHVWPAVAGGVADKPTFANGEVLAYSYAVGTGYQDPAVIEALISCRPDGTRTKVGEVIPGTCKVLVCINAASALTFNASAGAGDYFAEIADAGPWREAGYVINNSTYAVPDTGGDAPQQYVKEYACTFAQSYFGSGAKYTSDEGYPHQGQTPYYTYGGVQKSVLGFASMTADLAGATVTKVEVYLYFAHWHYNSGGTAVIGVHRHTAEPATFSDTSSPVASAPFAKPQGLWVTLPSTVHAGFKAGTHRGVSLHPTSTSASYYGYAHGVGMLYPPKMRVTYTK